MIKTFWNDSDGLTVVDILAIILGIGTLLAYWRYGSVDTNYADIVVASLLSSAGQKIGVNYIKRGSTITASTSEANDVRV